MPSTMNSMQSQRPIFVRSAAAVSLVGITALLAASAFSEDTKSVDAVTSVYLNNCAVCHGTQGRGDGEAAYLVFPKPRDFTSGIYRFKSTPQNQPPTIEDVIRNVSRGIPRTAMPAFKGVLSDDEIRELATYVLDLNETATRDLVPTPLTMPEKPEFDSQLIAEGRLVYDTMRCAQCHGETGRGDGPSSWDLVDSNGFPLPPADYTTGVFKAGDQSEDLYRTILVGVPGTPMPSFQSALDAGIKVEGIRAETDQVWAMVAFLESLAEERERPGVASGASIEPTPVADTAMFSDPFAPAWAKIEPTPISLQPLWQRTWSARAAELRVASNRTQMAFCIEWPDESFDATEGVSSATDAVAVMFSLTGNVIPMIPMGGRDDQGNEQTVNVWHWKASRQLDTDAEQRHDFGAIHPGEPADLYMFKSGDPVSGPLAEHDSTFVPAWNVGNLNSTPDSIGRPVFESNAGGFGTLTLQPSEEQHVAGVGRFANGVWRVVMVRDLEHGGEDDVMLTGSQRVPFALAVWNGAAMDRNGTKLVSGWHFLQVQARR